MTPRWLYWPASTSDWVPSDLTSLVLWLDASDGGTVYDATSGGSLVTSHNTQVKRWEDKSGNGHHATQNNANGPKRQTTSGTLNNLPVMKFIIASNSLLTIPDAASFRTYPLIVYSVIRTSQTDTNKGVIGKWGTAGQREWVLQHNDAAAAKPIAAVRNSADSANFAATGASTIHNGAGRLLGTTLNPPSGDIDLWIDGVSVATAAVTSSNGNSTTSVAVGSYQLSSSTNGLTGDIAEIVIANTSTASDREKVEGYLAHKWGLASSLPTGHPYKSSAP